VKRTPRLVWLVTFPGAELLDAAGPWEVFGHANELLGHRAYECSLVTPFGGDVRTRHDIVLGGAVSLRTAERRGLPDLLVVAGGSPARELPRAERQAVVWLQRNHARVAKLVSICTGAFVLGEAGLLDGRRATTHWRFTGELRSRFPKANVVDDGIFERAGRVWTSAGISSGIDLTLALVEADHGRALAIRIARTLVLFLRRSGHQAQFSEALKQQAQEPHKLADITTFILEHLCEALPVERIARQFGMSARSLARTCRAELRESPAALVRRLRLSHARKLLEEHDLPLKAVAQRTGLGDASTLWRAFTRQLGITPAEYRTRFATPSADNAASGTNSSQLVTGRRRIRPKG
jgi:transcriptional regulator GlxA family with amidase domain